MDSLNLIIAYIGTIIGALALYSQLLTGMILGFGIAILTVMLVEYSEYRRIFKLQ